MHLFLVGPPGVGKSAVAPLLARALGGASLDLDEAIERLAGKSCKAILEQDGGRRFHDLEREALTRLAPTAALIVVATGGRTPVDPANRSFMRSRGLVIGLRGSVATVARGIAATMAKRAAGAPPRERARAVLRERSAAYADTDAAFAVDGATPGEIALAIAVWLVAGRGLRVDVPTARPYPVLIRAGVLGRAGAHLRDLGWTGPVALVCDATSARLHAPAALASLRAAGIAAATVRVGTGESAKSVRSLERLWEGLALARIGRDGGVVALGGGSTGDLAGFAAATYLRGIRVAHIPTTLLAMVDSAIGGKTGIDLRAGKNLAGAFHQPDAVLGDPAILATLPARQRSSGLAEIVKCAYLADRASVSQLERSMDALRAGDLGPTAAAVLLAVGVKAAVVGRDERESGLRELLNFGHTFGHAYETATAYRVAHGEAVAVGMVFAAALAERLGLASGSLRRDLTHLLRRAGLPVAARIPKATWGLLARDKKARAGRVRWILPRGVGRFTFVTDVAAADLAWAASRLEGR